MSRHKTNLRIAAGALACILHAVVASSALALPYNVKADAKHEVAFHSKATLESFDGKTKNVSASLDIDPSNLLTARGKVTVDLRSLDTGIDLRNKHMRENHLHTDSFPNAEFTVDSVTGVNALPQSGSSKVTVWGAMKIHGTTKPLAAPATITPTGSSNPSSFRLQSEFPLKITDYGIPRPEFLFLKLAEEVRLTVDLTLMPKGE